MRLFLICVTTIIMAFSNKVSAFDVSKKSKGDITHWIADNGRTKITYLGKTRFGYKLKFERDGSKGEPLRGVFWSDRKGQAVRAKFQNYPATTYSPHDCSLTVGSCSYVESNPRIGTRKVFWEARVVEGRWSYKMYHSKIQASNLLEDGEFTVDQYGYYIDRVYRTYTKGRLKKERWTKRAR